MKKKFLLCLSIILAFSFLVNIGKNSNDKAVFAENMPKEVFVSGECEESVDAEIMSIDFCLKHFDENFVNGQKYVSDLTTNFCEKLKEIDENASCDICFMSCKPNFGKDTTRYCFEQCLCVKTKLMDKTQEIINIAGECGLNGYNNVRYELEDKKEIFSKVLKCALDNSFEKATSLIDNPVLDKVFESDVYCYEQNNQIIIKANVRAKYTSGNLNQQKDLDLINREIEKEQVK